jgi:TM2 domain-containing membrane protein YozV
MNKAFLLLMMLISGNAFSSFFPQLKTVRSTDTILVTDSLLIAKLIRNYNNEINTITPDEKKRKKALTAMLAFPFPFGFMGAHRVMLGCKPWVPVVYVATFGGCFGLIPLIDFIAIIASKDIEEYENNPHVFMWLK